MIPVAQIGHTLRAIARSMGLIGVLAFTLVDGSLLWLLPGLNDIVLISFVISKHTLPWAVAGVITATAGSVIGASTLYGIARKGGAGIVQRRFPQKLMLRIEGWIHHLGAIPVGVAALLPPPCPYAPFVLSAGILKVPKGRFRLSVGIGRGLRYSLDAALALYLGTHLLSRLHAFYWAALEPTIVVIAVGLLIWWVLRLQFASRRGYLP